MSEAGRQRRWLGAGLPSELEPSFGFQIFNALSYQMILGSPMVLFAKSLDASATVLGVIAGMMPLLVIFQIPAASHIDRVGYKKFVFAGWGIRVAFIFLMAVVPILGLFLNAQAQLVLMLCLLFGFNLSRGISSAAWLPWISSIVPTEIRGKYFAREAACISVASCATLCFAGVILMGEPASWRFAVLFAFSAAMGAVSLQFLSRIPEGSPPPVSEKPGGGAIPWGEIARHEPFRKLLRLQILWAVAYGGINTFTVAYLKASAGMSESLILILTGIAFLGGLAGLIVFGGRTDRFGSKPVVTFCLVVWMVIMVFWLLMAGGKLRPGLALVFIVELVMGLAFALVNMNNTRLATILAPAMGRNHFFALYSVVQNLVLGLAPVLWGILIDAIGTKSVRWGGFEWNRYAVFFSLVLVAFLGALVLTRRLEEPKAREVDELLRDLIVQSPFRAWVRLWWR